MQDECQKCRKMTAVTEYLVKKLGRSRSLQLCKDCAIPLEELLELPAKRRRHQVTTMAEIRRRLGK